MGQQKRPNISELYPVVDYMPGQKYWFIRITFTDPKYEYYSSLFVPWAEIIDKIEFVELTYTHSSEDEMSDYFIEGGDEWCELVIGAYNMHTPPEKEWTSYITFLNDIDYYYMVCEADMKLPIASYRKLVCDAFEAKYEVR